MNLWSLVPRRLVLLSVEKFIIHRHLDQTTSSMRFLLRMDDASYSFDRGLSSLF